MAVFCYIPNIKVPILSKMGANTLSVYFWHVPVLNLIKLTPFFTMVFSLGDPMYKIILLTFAVIITLVLSLNVFMFPLKALSKLLDKLKPCWCYVVIAAPFVAGAVLHYNEIIDKISQLCYRITK